MENRNGSAERFAVYAWGVVALNLFVILWGAFVRASGSGAGCGSHWPLCNGAVVPHAPQFETIIEFTHRATSGVALLLVAGLAVWAFRVFRRGHMARTGAVLSVVFILTEALIGAGLVLFELVADDDSVARALSLGIHLINTFILLAALALTAWWASGGGRLRAREGGVLAWMLLAALPLTLLVGVSGAVAALGDTLFPAASLAEGIRQDFSPTAHILVRLRLIHPVLSVAVGAYLVVAATVAMRSRDRREVHRWAKALALLVVVQLGAGLLNVALLAPIWLQLTHLLLADFLWLALVLLTASALSHVSSESMETAHARFETASV